ncbi:hypothetical protein AVEN_85918-1 [Araneus ventricosus]|uniref:Integrase zinc-binding domain-containing protein n=1 Tax=Araneus ventricosus TaxID=182803 RepID=A0A4Y2R6V0_ARAVE|nr:hypothetical protein AVEN_14203-1 [Araneus ventricosus]GBN71480.1 hypothetical protein AVEN_47533-1 [Araneus ventricosus]GBN71484.1 hypothetical protein AVEN_77455-1 [Araneus ventricosus]GBN71492.1 hypothetical protein AVEN_85918-1 [Araneus ventricosus]
MNPEITALNRLRGALRQSVTKLENYIKQCASEDKVVLETKLTKVDTIRKKLFDLQKRYYELPPEADLTETDEAIEQMETSLEEMEVSLKYLISKHNIDDKSTKLNIKENKTGKLLSVKLPDIPLPQFSGKYEEFGNFKSQFISLIEDNDGLSNTQKLYYLKSSLTGEAKLIQTTDDTYKSLRKALEDRYENKRAVVDSQILSLINLEKLNYESAEDLRKLLDTVKKNLRTLKTFEYERNNLSDVLIINLILQKLDKETRKQFEITLKSKEVPDLDNFLTFLENRSLVLEYVNKNVPSKSFSEDQSYHKGFSSNDKQKPKYHQYAKPNKSFVVDSFDSTKSEEEKFCEEHFLKTHTRTKSGRYIVSLPMKENADSMLGFSRENAVKRLNGIWNKLNKNNTLATLYKAFLQEYLDLGHMQQIIDEDDNTKSYYIPHHCIYKPEKTTTPLRVVFDASAKTSTGQSLNSILLNGGSIQDDLFSLVTRFRTHKYAFSADIQKMYRQILVEPSQRYLQRIVWKETNNSPIKIYELNTYGTVSAPFLAMRVLKAFADAEHQDFPEAAKIISRDMYMDDILSGATSLTSAKRLQADLSKLLRRGGFELHKWVSNHPALLNDISTSEYSFEDTQSNTVKALGMLWKPQPDQLTFKVSVKKKDSLTKREVLSQIARLYDPLGIIGPVIAKAKIFMQSLWLQKLDWHDNLPTKVLQVWNDFLVKLPGVNEINVPRYILSEDVTKIELHGFSDASERAYGAVIYIRCVTHSGLIQTKLVCSKSRVSPLKPITVPRLELSAALLLARLTHKIVPVLDLPLDKICLWTDSTIVLAWLNMQPHMLKTFVSNRVAKIQSLCSNSQWRHVSSKCNPADVLSRGADAKDLRDNDLWWQGPEFLLRDITDPEEYPCPKDKTFEQELKRNVTVSCAVTTDSDFLDKLLNLTNNYSKLIRILSFCCRFIKNCLHKNVETGFLTAAELDNAEQLLIKQVQSTTFPKEITALQDGKNVPVSSKLKSLDPFLDNNSILRVGGRLKNANLDYDAKHQIILPNGHKITKLIFEFYHKKYLHLGAQGLLHQVRLRYWPLNGKSTARMIVHNCVICYKNKPVIADQIMGNLPKERVTPISAFTNCGIDFCGPFLIKFKNQRKGIYSKNLCSYIHLSIN